MRNPRLEKAVSIWQIGNVTTIEMGKDGRLVLPKEIRDRHSLADGSVFAVLETKSGQIVLRAINPRPKLTLIEHLLKFKGVEIPEMHFHAKPRV